MTVATHHFAPGGLLLVDVSCWAYRFFHTTGRHAAWHAHQFVERVARELRPAYAAQCCDGPEKTFRHKRSRAYKAKRGAPDPELLRQRERLEWSLEDGLGIRRVASYGYEADDVMATLVERARCSGAPLEVVMLALDKDLLQLVDERCCVWNGHRGKKCKLFRPRRVRARYGVGPEQMRDWQALVGDSTDGVAGARGIGPKQAAAILAAFGTLEAALKVPYEDFVAAPGLSRSAYDRLHGGLRGVELALDLVTLRRDAPLEHDGLGWLRWRPDELLEEQWDDGEGEGVELDL